MKTHVQKIVLATLTLAAMALTDSSASAASLNRSWRTSPGDESWYIHYTGTDPTGVELYTFSYRGTFISGGGRLKLYPGGYIRAVTTHVSRDFLNHAIPRGSVATGRMTGANSFYLDGFRLDLMVRRLSFH